MKKVSLSESYINNHGNIINLGCLGEVELVEAEVQYCEPGWTYFRMQLLNWINKKGLEEFLYISGYVKIDFNDVRFLDDILNACCKEYQILQEKGDFPLLL